MTKKINITTIGWGSGTFNVIYGLKKVLPIEERNLTTIIAMTDSWGTTWEIRDKFWVLPPWDIRRAICALARDTGIVRKLFEYKFKDETWVIGGNKIGNILLTALADIKGWFEPWLDEACKMFDVEGKIIPVTLEDVHLWVEFEDGTQIVWEKHIDVSSTNPWERTHNIDQNIVNAFLVWWDGELNPRAYEAIMNSDFIILGPGDFYTSIVPNLLSKWMKEALAKTPAKIIYVCNIMTKQGETTTYELPDFIENIEKYAWEVLDYVFVNNGYISDELVAKYKLEEWKKPVKKKESMIFSHKKYRVIERDFVNESDVVRHDPMKLAYVIQDMMKGWIK